MNCDCRTKDSLQCRSCLEFVQRKYGDSVRYGPYLLQKIAELKQQKADLVVLLEKLFQAYQTLDEDTMPEDTLPLEQIQDIMPEIEQALADIEGK